VFVNTNYAEQAQALAFDRCASVLSASTRGSDLAAAVCMHACRCLATAAQFDACRQRLVAMPNVFDNVVRVLRYAVGFCAPVGYTRVCVCSM
jgi:hypothetical protein